MNVAFIPVRGGSKSIPLKNIKEICGKPLVYWAIKAAAECEYIDFVYVATDCEKIKTVIDDFLEETICFKKVKVIGRAEETASDTASTESAMLEFASNYNFKNIVLIQATSPLLTYKDLDNGFRMYMQENVDSVLSVVRQKRFHWCVDEFGYSHPTNYDVYNRPRRQEFEGYLVENGAFYITSKELLLKTKNRVSGNIKAVEMHEDTFIEIDEPSDWTIMELLMKKNGFIEDVPKTKLQIPDIKMFLTDCDGCLTDGGMYYSENGDELKKYNTRDGMGIGLLQAKGIITGIITGEDAKVNRRRAEKLKLDILVNGCKNKAATIRRLCYERGIDLKNVAYVGDDINDLDAIKIVGFGCCPSDAVKDIRDSATYIAEAKGGEGVIREIVDLIINR